MFRENKIENSIENSREKEPREISSNVSLEFFRHDEKEKAAEGQKDQEVPLTGKGKKHARSLSKPGDIKQAVAFGSPFRRAKETIGQIMAGEELSLTGDESLEEMKAKIDEGREYGTKLGADKRLGFDIDKNSQYGKEAYAAFGNGEWLKYLVERSDQAAEEFGDDKSSTYSRQAAGIAKIVDKYIKIAPRFDSLVQEKGYASELKRFFGSHQGVLESFLAKIIEKTKGKEELGRFVGLGKQGFGYAEGFKMNIANYKGSKEPSVVISYEKKEDGKNEPVYKFEEKIDPKLIAEIINEGKK